MGKQKRKQITYLIPMLLAVIMLVDAFTLFAAPVRDLPGKNRSRSKSNNEKINPIDLPANKVPSILEKRPPTYPPPARKANIKGKVVLQITTDIYGRVIRCKVITGHPLLRLAAVQAARNWLYEPYLQKGKAHPVRFNQTISFGKPGKKGSKRTP